jgi:hypothetical protein
MHGGLMVYAVARVKIIQEAFIGNKKRGFEN